MELLVGYCERKEVHFKCSHGQKDDEEKEFKLHFNLLMF